jgi:autotransporter passenger strand-loop-strand repeat protein
MAYTGNISSGMVVSGENISGSQAIQSGGIASTSIITSGGIQKVFHGGLTQEVTIESKGLLIVDPSGSANIITQQNGAAIIANTDSLINSGTNNRTDGHSNFYIVGTSDNRVAHNFLITSSGRLSVNNDHSTIDALVQGGEIVISNGGFALDTDIDNGTMIVKTGGAVRSTTIKRNNGNLILSGGIATSTTVSAGVVTVDYQAIASKTTLGGGSLSVLSNGMASSSVINGGSMLLASGGRANTTVINNFGQFYINSGATATSTTLNYGAALHLSAGGIVNYLEQHDSSIIKTTTQATILHGTNSRTGSNANFSISNGVARNFLINNNGSLSVANGDIAYNTEINYGGMLDILSGGSASTIIQHDGGEIKTNTGATIASGSNTRTDGYTNFSISNGVARNFHVTGYGYFAVNQGDSAFNSYIDHGGGMQASGYISGTKINNGSLTLWSSGGSAINTTIGDGGTMDVALYTTATSTTISSGGLMKVGLDGSATQTTVNNGGSMLVSDAQVSNVSVFTGGTIKIIGSSATNLVLNGGAIIKTNTEATITSGLNYRSDGNHSKFSITGHHASNFLLQNGGRLELYGHWGSATDTLIDAGGILDVGYGTANIVHQSAGGAIMAKTSAIISNATNTRSDGGSNFYISNGLARNFLLNNHGELIVEDSQFASDTIISSGGKLIISSGGSATRNRTFTGGKVIVYNGVVSQTILYSGGSLIMSGGRDSIASEITISSGGILNLGYYSGTATGVTQATGGAIIAYTNTTLSAGTNTRTDGHNNFSIISGVASNFMLYNSGLLYVGTDEMAIDTRISSGGSMVLSSGTASSTIIHNGGKVIARSGGLANSTTVYSGGELTVSNAGSAVNNYISAGGLISIASSGSIGGNLMVNSGTVTTENRVTMSGSYDRIYLSGSANLSRAKIAITGTSGLVVFGSDPGCNLYISGVNNIAGDISITNGSLFFNIVGMAPNTTAMLTDFTDVATNNFKLRVNHLSSSIAPMFAPPINTNGSYNLANNASSFTGSITVFDGDDSTGYVSLTDSFIKDHRRYSLSLTADRLMFNIAAVTAIIPNDFNGNGSSDILWHNSNTGLTGTWQDGDDNNWQEFGSAPPANWEIVGTGDFKGDGKTDIIWQATANSGMVGIWNDGNGAWEALGSAPRDSWSVIAGSGDFDGNGHDDILWQNSSTGLVGIWEGGDSANWQAFGSAPVDSWEMVEIGDFKGDGKTDIVWQNKASGLTGLWNDGNGAWESLGTVSRTAWEVVGAGDFTGDGKADLLWQNKTNGMVGMWNDGNPSDWQSTGSAPVASWNIESVDDFDGNGHDDILWRGSNGTIGIWANGESSSWQQLGNVSNDWAIANG